MGTYKKYIDDLEIQKNNLVTALNNKGVEATNTETLNTLVPKVANIEGAKEEQEKTASASPNGAVIVTPDTGKVLSKVTINTIPTTTQATPTIAVSSGGLITVTSKQTEGYVKAGTKMPIKQLDVQGTKTITPSTSSQTAVSAYKFTTGAITVKGDANLKAENIKKDVSIFGVTGSLESGGSGGYSITFPTTATNWNKLSFGSIIQTDGNMIDMSDYSKISGKTFSNVVAIRCEGNTTYALRMGILSGKIATVITTSMYKDSFITTDGGTTFTSTGNGSYWTWILLADTVLSSIEMYDTD